MSLRHRLYLVLALYRAPVFPFPLTSFCLLRPPLILFHPPLLSVLLSPHTLTPVPTGEKRLRSLRRRRRARTPRGRECECALGVPSQTRALTRIT
ncbi:hypothetical protein FB451DRAFT_1235852 [Mycena latifolia]|nr:hypothetical protein FB451DRAFT_1235852 [Mycena latifolia]